MILEKLLLIYKAKKLLSINIYIAIIKYYKYLPKLQGQGRFHILV